MSSHAHASARKLSAENIRIALTSILIIGAILWFIAACAYGIHNFGVNYSLIKHHYYSPAQYVKQAGLDTSKPLPLQLGVTGAVTSYNMPQAFLLTGKDSVSQGLQPSTNLRLLVQFGAQGRVIEVPFTAVTFRKGLKDGAGLILQPVRYGQGSVNYSWSFGSFLLFRPHKLESKQPGIQQSSGWYDFSHQDVIGFVQRWLMKVDITLTPADYQTYFGGK